MNTSGVSGPLGPDLTISGTNPASAPTPVERPQRGVNAADQADRGSAVDVDSVANTDAAGLSAVNQSISEARTQVDVALSTADQAQQALTSLRDLAINASDSSLSGTERTALVERFNGALSTFNQTLASADFNGTNVLVAGGGDITASISADSEGSISISNLDVTVGGENLPLSLENGVGTPGEAASTLAAIDQSIAALSAATTTLTATSDALESSQQFISFLASGVEEGIGALVDPAVSADGADTLAGQIADDIAGQPVGLTSGTPGQLNPLLDPAI